MAGQAQPQSVETGAPKFEVASVRLMVDRDKLPMQQRLYHMSPPGAGEFTVRNATLEFLIGWAFSVGGYTQPISGKPDWMRSTYYEIAAKPEGNAGLSYAQLRPLMQQLLQERFHLAYHRAMGNAKGYALVVAKGGAKLTPANGSSDHAYMMAGRLDAAGASTDLIAGLLAYALDQPVVDRTGLKGKYDFKLNYAPMEAADSTLPSIFTAAEEQLGLKLEKQMVPVEMFVIDHVDRAPAEN